MPNSQIISRGVRVVGCANCARLEEDRRAVWEELQKMRAIAQRLQRELAKRIVSDGG